MSISWPLLGRDLALGVGAGLISGFFGVGGGIIVVPIMVIALHFAQKRAQATSLVMISCGGIAGVISYAIANSIAWLPALFIVLGSMTGAWIGAHLVQKVPDRKLQMAFGLLLIVIALRMLFVDQSATANDLPALTTVLAFRASGAETLRHIDEVYGDDPVFHWTSTQAAAGTAYQRTTYLGTQFAESKTSATATQVRAIRRIQVLP